MPYVRQVELVDVLSLFPEIEPLDVERDLVGGQCDLFLCALGFEDRCLSIPELIARTERRQCADAICFEYATNVNDNEVNKPRLLTAIRSFSASASLMPCDADDFPTSFRKALSHVCAQGKAPVVTFDISVCSSKLLLLALKVIFEFDLSLRVVYSEAQVYHPTYEEYASEPEKWTTEEGFGLARGVSTVTPSMEHPGYKRDRLQEAVIVFPTFKPERARAVVAEVDESLAMALKDRVIWIVGDPRLPEDNWRVNAIREINKIPLSASSYTVSTFHYKRTVETLERIYQPMDCKRHVTISPLGSKMQSIGIALFWHMRQEVSIVFATPKEYNAGRYSEGCKGLWQVRFGELAGIRQSLDRVGQLKILG